MGGEQRLNTKVIYATISINEKCEFFCASNLPHIWGNFEKGEFETRTSLKFSGENSCLSSQTWALMM